jgi:hypothetical protein
MIGKDIYVVEDRIVCRWKQQCCLMVITIYQELMKLFPPTWQHHRLMIASTVVSSIHWYTRLILGVDGKANLRPDASLLQ